MSELIRERPGIDEIVDSVAIVFDVFPAEIVERRAGRQKRNIPRQVAMYCSQRIGGHSQKEIARYFSMANRGGVASAVYSIECSLAAGDLSKQFDRVLKTLNVTKST